MVHSNRTGHTLVPGSLQGPAGGAGLDAMLEVVGDSPASGSPHAFLLVISGAEPGRLHVLEKPELVIGRSKYADIRISERAMSQQHAKIVNAGDGHRIYDLGSTNGTFVNDQQIESVDLRVGDVVRTGETVFTYMSSGAAVAPGGTDSTMALPSHSRSGAAPRPGQHVHAPHPSAGAGGGALVLRSQVAPAAPMVAPQVIGVPAAAPPPDDETDAIGIILKVLDFAKRYWMSIIFFALVGVALGVASYKVSKPPAVATFEVQLIPKPADNMMTRGRRMNFEFFRSAQKRFSRPSVIRASLQQLGEEDINADRLRRVRDSLTFKQASKKVAKDIYEGSYRAKTAEEAVEYLRVHLQVFIDTEIENALKVLYVEVDALEKKLKAAEEDLSATEQAVMAFNQEHSEGLPDQAQELYQQLIALRTAKGATAGELVRASETLRTRRKALKSEAPEIESRIEAARPYEISIADLNQQLAEARAAGKASQHPDVIKLKRQKKNLEAQRDEVLRNGGGSKIVRERNPLYEGRREAKDNAEADMRIAQSQLSRLTNDLERTQKLVDDLPRLQREYAELTRSYEATQGVHKRLFDSLESSRIQLDMERAAASARYDITTPPNVVPVSKVKTIVTRAGVLGFLGFGFGVFLGLVRDLRRLIATRMAQQRNA
ncbi:MAG: FHA domain-containing protein [Myxococcota bacterium]